MDLWALFFITSTALASLGFVVVAVLWLKKLRETLSTALGKSASQQIQSAQRTENTLLQMQKQQNFYEQRLRTLTEANIVMRQELNALAGKVETNKKDETGYKSLSSKMLH